MGFASRPLKILLVARDDDQTRLIRAVLAASAAPRFQMEHASNGWEAQCQTATDSFAALVIDDRSTDNDGTLLGRLRALGNSAPALLLTSTDTDQAAQGCDDSLASAEALMGSTLARTIVAMVQRNDLNIELTAARDQAARATAQLADLAHDLATPLGVVMGTTMLLLSGDHGLNADDQSCLEDVSEAALRASEILKRLNDSTSNASTSPSPQAPARDIRRATVSGPGMKMVLIADDDAATRRMVSATLASDHYSVLQAADGQEAWRLIREHHPAVAILDWQMPVYSGLELTDVIKGDPQVQNMTVIMLTGRTTQADREAGARAHADLYLTKPFSPQELLAAVEQALGVS